MNADAVLARLAADLQVSYAMRQADRPSGLTASSVGGCMSYAARTLLNEPLGDSADFWRAQRGTYVHNGLADDLAAVDPGFVDGRRAGRFTWEPGGGLPPITGEFDLILAPPTGTGSVTPPVLVEVKTRSRDECRWHADHGASPQESMQAAMAAEALGVPLASVVYVPTDAGWEEAAACMVDVDHWAAEARAWLFQVDVRREYEGLVERGTPPDRAFRQVIDPVPRDKPVSWCRLLCPRVKACRGDYETPTDLEIADPVLREAAAQAAHWRQVRLDAARLEQAALSQVRHAEGTVHDDKPGEVRVRQQHVAPKAGRRGHTRTVVERRPE